MSTKKGDPFNRLCPSRSILSLIGSKWAMLLVCVLRDGPVRTGVIKRQIDGISQKMLTQTLRDLERHGIVQRIDHAEVPPRVEYHLTRLGLSLSDLVSEIETWVSRNYSKMATMAKTCDTAERAN
jgi:DNA-binding HxlR family transcriptional regulator